LGVNYNLVGEYKMFYFNSRDIARNFAAKRTSYKLVDMGPDAPKRWAVQVAEEKS
jgi:hypothetical protein